MNSCKTPLLREARGDEAASLSALALRSKAHWEYDAAFMEVAKIALTYSSQDLADNKTIVAEIEGEIAGFSMLDLSDNPIAELEALFVDPPWIGKGIGKQLFHAACADARTSGSVAMLVESDPNALPFYLSQGGRVIGDRVSKLIPGRALPLVLYVPI